MSRRSLLAALTVAAALALPVIGAAAGPGASVTVVSRSGLPSPLLQLRGGSSCGTADDGTIAHIAGPAGAPLGRGSLAVTVPAHGYYGVEDNFPLGTDVADLTTLSLAVYQPAAATVPDSALGLSLGITTTPDTDGLYFSIALSLPAPDSAAWQTADLFAAGTTITWTKYKQAGGTTTQISHDTEPWTTFASHNPTAALSELAIAAAPSCGLPATTFDLDDLVIGTGNTVTTYDFEPLVVTTLRAKVPASKRGHIVTPRVTLTAPGGSASGVPVTLWAEPATAKSYRQIAAATTSASGTATAKPVHLAVDTALQWRYAGSADNAAAASKPLTVMVASTVTLVARGTTLKRHSAIRAAGRVTRARKGTRVTLWRVNGRHRVALGHARERTTGAYTITKRLPAGHYTVIATVARSRYNTVGTSARRTVTLRSSRVRGHAS